jgi:toxin ParE1/3/4
MPTLRKSPAAAEDLIEIWAHIADESTAAADRIWQRLQERFQLLLQQPLMGESKEQYRPNLRSVVEGQYVIFYEPQDDGILIYRVLHGARRWQEML